MTKRYSFPKRVPFAMKAPAFHLPDKSGTSRTDTAKKPSLCPGGNGRHRNGALPLRVPFDALWYFYLPKAAGCVTCGVRRLEPTTGFEPVTCCLRNSCSTTELRRRR